MKNILKIKLPISIFLLLFCSFLIAQNDYFSPSSILRFADHLYGQKDYERAAAEFLRFQYLTQEFSDSINFKIADCYSKVERFDDSNKYLNDILVSSDNTFFRQKSNYQILKNHFQQNKYEQILETPIPTEKNIFHDDLIFLHTYSLIYQLKLAEADFFLKNQKITNSVNNKIFENLQDYCEEGSKLKRKSPFLAASFSAIIPGLGKVYTKRPKDALTSFVTTGMFSYLAYHNYQKNGIESLRFNIYAGLSIVFYFSNIYGSTISAKQYNHNLINDYLQKLDIQLR